MCSLKDNEAPLVGFSSVGPTVYAVIKNSNHIEKVCKNMSLDYHITKVDNEGIIKV